MVALFLLILGFLLPVVVAGRSRNNRQQLDTGHLILDFLEAQLDQGIEPRQAFAGMERCGDPQVALQIRRLQIELRAGTTWEVALCGAFGFPPQIGALLDAGEKSGGVRPMLDVLRHFRRRARSLVDLASNGQFLLHGGTVPVVILGILGLLNIYIAPRFRMLLVDMADGGTIPPYFALPDAHVIGGACALWIGALVVGAVALANPSPKWRRWLDPIQCRLPWRRRRSLHDFSLMLGELLDAGIPEETALKLAASVAGNQVVAESTGQAVAALREGRPLADAVSRIDPSGQCAWHVRAGAVADAGFSAAFSGWLAALDARAFRQEQVVVQALLTSLVAVNGLLVGLTGASVFVTLTQLFGEVSVW